MNKKTLVIVESPAKTKTISKILKSDYKVIASLGHIRDLPSAVLGVSIDKDFAQKYVVSTKKKNVVEQIKKDSKNSKLVLLATDPDREGEAISWHISEILPKDVPFKRITFNAIEESAIKKAIENPRDIDQNLVDSQKARRVLDRISGYKGSSWLQRFLQDKNLSCGRVQSVALKFLVQREKEIRDFVSKEYWNMFADFSIEKHEYKFSLYSVKGKKIEQKKLGESIYLIDNEEKAKEIEEGVKNAQNYYISEVSQKQLSKVPKPPYTTSTLQQDAHTKLGMPVKKTMKIAQELYEGINSDSGYITYMRTDSVSIDLPALKKIREYIKQNYYDEYSNVGRKYKSSKSSQEAHEAIRPTNVEVTPEKLQGKISDDQLKIYTLIWNRTVASQMKNAVYGIETYSVSDKEKVFLFRATNNKLLFKGFSLLYKDDELEVNNSIKAEEGQQCILGDVQKKKSNTKPPARFSEASLVKKLESEGVGRPSTYAPTIDRIEKYTEKLKKNLVPTEKGELVCDTLDKFLPLFTSATFTSDMEDNLESIEKHEKSFLEVMKNFWEKFKELLDKAQENMPIVEKEETDKKCPSCGAFMYRIKGRYGYFFGCSGHPECKTVVKEEKPKKEINLKDFNVSEEFDYSNVKCNKCKEQMILRQGPYGVFFGCSKFPKCKNIVGIPKKEDISDQICEKCKKPLAYTRNKKSTYCFECLTK